MASMEGPLSKWTNVVKGWQYRWFVLDETSGLLSYYTSKEKMMRGARRGCVRLKGAVIGIDDENDSTFTITVDQKTFHFEARDSEEKERWIDALENTIQHHKFSNKRWDAKPVPSMSEFDKKLAETDAYLQLLIEQVEDLEKRIQSCEDTSAREKFSDIKDEAEAMIEAVKQSIVLLQISKHTLKERYCQLQDFTINTHHVTTKMEVASASMHVPVSRGAMETGASPCIYSRSSEVMATPRLVTSRGLLQQEERGAAGQTLSSSLPNLTTLNNNKLLVSVAAAGGAHADGGLPSDHVADHVDAQEGSRTAPPRRKKKSPRASSPGVMENGGRSQGAASDGLVQVCSSSAGAQGVGAPGMGAQGVPDQGVGAQGVPDHSYSSSEDEDFFDAEEGTSPINNGVDEPSVPQRVIAAHDDYFDELYDGNEEDDLDHMESHGSMLSHLLSQVRIGMDLTKVTLPTFILEKRSLLEMFADFFAHPDIFVAIADQKSPRDRLVQTVRWYMSAFHAGRKTHVAKKPYNPILGETFQCFYDVPNAEPTTELATDGPIPWAKKHNVTFLAEQVSHHPPISAFYAESIKNRICLDGYIWTKSKFLGLSIGVHNIGQGVVSVLDYDEDYVITFPNGYGRSILTVPWMEMGGSVSVTCPKTGYYANIEFHTKPFYGGKKNQISAEMYAPNDKKSFMSVKGDWTGTMWAKHANGMNEVFVDTKTTAIVKKRVKPIDQQVEFESRRLWQNVTKNLKEKNIEEATEHKRFLEQRQREEAKERKECGVNWETKQFHEVGEHWVYDGSLVKRLGRHS